MFAAVQTAVYVFQQQQNENNEMEEEMCGTIKYNYAKSIVVIDTAKN